MDNRGIFVKVNCKNIGEVNSFVYDMNNNDKEDKNKYLMCAGKYDKEGWTIVFKAKNINEAQELVERNKRKTEIIKEENSKKVLVTQNLDIEEEVLLPSWMIH